MKRRIAYGAGTVLLLAVIFAGFFMFIRPLRTRSGIIDTTYSQCYGHSAGQIRRFHLLLGQSHDYDLIAGHVLPASAAQSCGQRLEIKLFL